MEDQKKRQNPDHTWWIAIVFLLMAASFIFDVWGDKKTIRENPLVEEEYYSTDLVREPFAEAKITQAGFKFNCNSCHDHVDSPETPRKLIAEHEDIFLDHEEVMTCYTCHSRENREKLTDIYGTEVAFEKSEDICRRCHGPRYRDWKLGIHGRPIGYWDKTNGKQKNATCVYCHDPHAPKFALMEPSPPPIRDHFIMGNKEEHHE